MVGLCRKGDKGWWGVFDKKEEEVFGEEGRRGYMIKRGREGYWMKREGEGIG